ncbi:potassium channel family protein [Kocuria palustris]|uniref:potassium channel family protein n=1 Tax=Kocuria palustris TaxID=71999 RepID=UPI00077B7352|nr:TrkA family potassium uptake protein [Kocuria palustris]
MSHHGRRRNPVLIVGLGRFGSALAEQLVKQNTEVLAIERDGGLTQQWTNSLTHAIEADATDVEVLHQIGVEQFDSAVVGVGTSIESSVLITANLVDLGIPRVWAKAISSAHEKILRRIGCHHVIRPEHDAGISVAHLVSGQMLDFIQFNEDFAIAKMRPPKELHGRSIDECQPRRRHGVNIIGVKSPGEDFAYAQPNTLVTADDTIIVSGSTVQLEKFADNR